MLRITGFSLLLFFSFISGLSSFSEIRRLLERGKIREGSEKLHEFIDRHPNHLEARRLLFKTYLKERRYANAASILEYLLALERSPRHLFFQAELQFDQGEWKAAEETCLLVLSEDRRDVPTMLLLARIHRSRNHNERAESFYQEAASINSRRLDYLTQYGDFLIDQKAYLRAEKILAETKKHYPEHPDYLYQRARLDFHQGKMSSASRFIRKALFYRPEEPDYRDLLKDIYHQQEDYSSLIRELEKSEKLDAAGHFQLAYVHFMQASPEGFRLQDPQILHLNIFPHLSQSVSLDETWELARYFTEELILVNLSNRHALREKWAAYHSDRTRTLYAAGAYAAAHSEYIRAIRLVPEKVSLRLDYAEFLWAWERPESYLDQLKLAKILGPKDEFSVEARIEKVERQLQDSLASRFEVDAPSLKTGRRTVLVDTNVAVMEAKTPLISSIFIALLNHHLRLSPNWKAVYTEGKLEDELQHLSPDYYLKIRLHEGEMIFSHLELNSGATRLLSGEKEFTTTGEYAWFDAFREIVRFLDEHVPLSGRILMKKQKSLLADMGSINGVSKGQKVQILIKNEKEVSGRCVEVNERLSEIHLDDEEDLSFIKAGDEVRPVDS